MKQVLAMTLCVLLALGLAGCFARSGEDASTPAATQQNVQATPSAQPSAEPTPEADTWETLYQKALALFMQGEDEAAYETFVASLDLDATHSEVWLDFLRLMRSNEDGYINTLRAALENTGDTETFQPLLDQAIAAAEPMEDGVIEWIDPVMEQLVREYLGKPSGDIMRSELDDVTTLGIFANAPLQVNTYCDNIDWNRSVDGVVYYIVGENQAYDQPCAITTLADFGNFRNLSDLFISDTGLTSIEGIENIKKLVTFHLAFSPLNDASPAAKSFRLQNLSLGFCGLSDISPLAEMPYLRELDLACNKISDVSALSGFVMLRMLELRDNMISDITPLSSLTSLTALGLGNNPLQGDIAALACLTNLEKLCLYADGITDIGALASLTKLRCLDLVDNQIEDISPVSGLTELVELYLGANRIADLNPLMSLSNLERLTLFGNAANDLTPLLALKKLQMLDVCGVNANKSLLYYIPEFHP